MITCEETILSVAEIQSMSGSHLLIKMNDEDGLGN